MKPVVTKKNLLQKLAIYDSLEEIIDLVKTNQVVHVKVPTGSGKSIGIPAKLIRDGAIVCCTQPTIPAAQSLCDFQKLVSPKYNIGYAAEGEKKYDKKSHMFYATAGHVRKVMLSHFEKGVARDMKFCDILLVDEIHIGSKDNTIIIALWMEARRQGKFVPNLIASTATDHGLEELKMKIGGVVFENDFRHFKVGLRYHNKSYNEPDDDMMFKDAARISVDLLLEKKGHGIVFCSGSAEVEEIVDNIKQVLKDMSISEIDGREIRVLPCFSQCKREEIAEAIRDEDDVDLSPGRKRIIKIVVATNIAESSLTIPGVIWIFDMMTEKRADMIANRFHLVTTWISKNSADQRKGRTGRTLHGGICYRMCLEADYEKFESFRPLEIKRTPVADVVIELMSCGLDPVGIISEIEPHKLEAAKRILSEIGCIILPQISVVSEIVNVPIVTKVGRFVSGIPMDVRHSAAFYYYLYGIEGSSKPIFDENIFWGVATLVIADLYGPSPTWMPRKKKDEDPKMYKARIREYIDDNFQEFEGDNPLETLLYIFKACMDHSPEHNIFSGAHVMKTWAQDHSMNNKKLREIIMQMRRMMKIISGMKNVEDKPFLCEYEEVSRHRVIECMPSINRSLHRVYRENLVKTMFAKYVSADGRLVFLDDTKTIFNILSDSVRYATAFIPLSEVEFTNKKTGKRTIIISLWIPIT
jgi:HrpA-like RNA helicase